MRPKLTSSSLFLITANIIPIIGVIYFGWDAIAILVLYWLESVVIGVLNIPKLLACREVEDWNFGSLFGNIFTALFFTVHFGGFVAAHGFVLYDVFGAKETMVSLLTGGPLLWTAITFFVSHSFSMFVNFFGKKEYLGSKSKQQFGKPYGRVVIMHIVVIFGGLLIQKFGSPLYALILLIALKTIIDLFAHNKEHAEKTTITT